MIVAVCEVKAVSGVVASECRYCHAVEVVCDGCGKLFVFRHGSGKRVHACLNGELQELRNEK